MAGIDSELWVSMIAETMKTFPASGSLNTEISDYDETRPIFTDMVNDLRRLVNRHTDLSMLPLECQYLNKAAFISVVSCILHPINSRCAITKLTPSLSSRSANNLSPPNTLLSSGSRRVSRCVPNCFRSPSMPSRR